MARKDALIYQLAAAKSLAASFNSDATIVKFLDNCAYQINVTTTNSIGTFAVQGSLDYAVDPSGAVKNAGTWVNLSLAGGTPSVSAANDQILIDLNQLPYYAIRLAYTSTTPGTGHCDIYVGGKQVGG